MLRRILALLLLLPASAAAQFVRGTITDVSTGVAIRGVNVTLRNARGVALFAIVADSTGAFRMPVPNDDPVSIRVERIGYATVSSRAFVLKRGDMLELAVILAPQAVALEAVKAVAKTYHDIRLEPYYRRAEQYKKAGIGRIWTRADLEKHPPTLMSHLLMQIPSRTSMLDPGMVKSVGLCTGSEVFVDGLPVKMRAEDPFDPYDLDLLVTPGDVEGVEFYRQGQIPFEYQQDLCDVTLIWRKPTLERVGPFSFKRALAGLAFVSAIVLANIVSWKL